MSVVATVLVLNFHFIGHRPTKVPSLLKRVLLIRNKVCDTTRILKCYNSHYQFKNRVDSPIFLEKLNRENNKNNCNTNINKEFDTESRTDSTYDTVCICTSEKNKRILKDILKLIEVTVDLLDKDRTNEQKFKNLQNEWKEVAKRIDFILFIFVSVVVIATPLFLFGKYYVNDYTTKNLSCNCEMN